MIGEPFYPETSSIDELTDDMRMIVRHLERLAGTANNQGETDAIEDTDVDRRAAVCVGPRRLRRELVVLRRRAGTGRARRSGREKAADAEAAAEAAATEAPPAEEADRDEVVEEEPAQEKRAADCVKVPNVVGEDHQLAQDTMQAAGLYMLDEEDASGEGRMLLLDRNWTTVKQRPKAGKCVDENTTILLSALKDEEV